VRLLAQEIIIIKLIANDNTRSIFLCNMNWGVGI